MMRKSILFLMFMIFTTGPAICKEADDLLFSAIIENDPLKVKMLIDYSGADVCARDEEGRTPLHYAVEYNDHEVVKALVDSGADVDAKDDDGETPLYLAAAADDPDPEIIKILRAAGAEEYSIEYIESGGSLRPGPVFTSESD